MFSLETINLWHMSSNNVNSNNRYYALLNTKPSFRKKQRPCGLICTQALGCSSLFQFVQSLRYGLDVRGRFVRFLIGGKRSISSPKSWQRLWVPPNLLFNGYRALFARNKSVWVLKLTTHFHQSAEFENKWRYTSTPPYGWKRLYLYLCVKGTEVIATMMESCTRKTIQGLGPLWSPETDFNVQ
jgi:hypothetical protein